MRERRGTRSGAVRRPRAKSRGAGVALRDGRSDRSERWTARLSLTPSMPLSCLTLSSFHSHRAAGTSERHERRNGVSDRGRAEGGMGGPLRKRAPSVARKGVSEWRAPGAGEGRSEWVASERACGRNGSSHHRRLPSRFRPRGRRDGMGSEETTNEARSRWTGWGGGAVGVGRERSEGPDGWG